MRGGWGECRKVCSENVWAWIDYAMDVLLISPSTGVDKINMSIVRSNISNLLVINVNTPCFLLRSSSQTCCVCSEAASVSVAFSRVQLYIASHFLASKQPAIFFFVCCFFINFLTSTSITPFWMFCFSFQDCVNMDVLHGNSSLGRSVFLLFRALFLRLDD